MSEQLYLIALLSFPEGIKKVEVFESDIDGILQFYHCVVNAKEHLNIMIDENAEWSEVNGKVSQLSQQIGEMIESKAA